LKGLASNSFLAGCMPHTLSHVGENSDLAILRDFVVALTTVTHSTNARAAFDRHFKETMQRYNQIRWYVVFEMYSQIGNNYPCLAPWLAECELWGHSPAGIAAIRKVVRDHGETLKLEIAIGMDVYRPFVEATYVLEGDGVLVFALADILDKLAVHVAMVRGGGAGTPNTRALAKAVVAANFGGELAVAQDVRVEALIAESLRKVERSLVYFEAKMVELKDMVDIFKACRLFDPSRAAAQCAHADEVERQLKLFPFIDDAKVALLVRD
jgi:hypothetical protein